MVKNNNTAFFVILIIVLVLLLFGGYGMMNLFGGHYVGFYGFGLLFWIIAFIAAIWVIYDVLTNNKGLSDGMKLLWIVCAIFFNIITAVIYYLVGRNNQNDLFRKNRR
jgi:phosphatidylglycerophosphate synthase